jgi:nucleoside-diphosphate-sugar epimerase
VGRALMRTLEAKHEAIAFDRDLAGVAGIEGDLCNASDVGRALDTGCEAIVHLATVPGGAAEKDPALAWRVNVEATRALFDAAARAPHPLRIVFASSIAVFGDPLPTPFNEDAPVAPTMLYGAHKAMMETWLTTLMRRGSLQGLALRLPGIVARPAVPAGLKSAFLSELFHALRDRQAIDLPVSPDATTLLMSVERTALNLVHALASGQSGCITLPATFVRMSDLVASVARQTGADPGLVRWCPDPAIEARFGRLPSLATPRAEALGFKADPGIEALASSALASL